VALEETPPQSTNDREHAALRAIDNAQDMDEALSLGQPAAGVEGAFIVWLRGRAGIIGVGSRLFLGAHGVFRAGKGTIDSSIGSMAIGRVTSGDGHIGLPND